MIKKNETQLNYLYGEEVVNTIKESIKTAIHNGQVKEVPLSVLEDDNKLDSFLKKNK